MIRPEPRSRWRNRKKGTIYVVWAISIAVQSGEEFVIYSEKNHCGGEKSFVAQHTENDGLLGAVLFMKSRSRWMIDWRYDPSPVTVGSFDAWARPLEVWSDKFDLLEDGQ